MSGHGPLIRRNVVHPVSGYQYLGSKRLKLAFLSEKGEIVRSKKKKNYIGDRCPFPFDLCTKNSLF